MDAKERMHITEEKEEGETGEEWEEKVCRRNAANFGGLFCFSCMHNEGQLALPVKWTSVSQAGNKKISEPLLFTKSSDTAEQIGTGLDQEKSLAWYSKEELKEEWEMLQWQLTFHDFSKRTKEWAVSRRFPSTEKQTCTYEDSHSPEGPSSPTLLIM